MPVFLASGSAGAASRRVVCALALAAVVVFATAITPLSGWCDDSAAEFAADMDKWQVELASHPAVPSLFLAIDKKKQQLYLMEQRSPLSVTNSFFCSTGEMPGDKQREGDLKTPEGVYFVQNRLDGGLDYELYGDLAFTLDYPNPVDRLKRKTGSGIWIHGRGHKPTPRETKGCMALDTPDVHVLDTRMERGTPVVIAGDVQWRQERLNSDVPDELVEQVQAWASSWQGKNEQFFSFYDQDRFAAGRGRPFNAFRNHKETLFRNLDWIQVMVSDVRVLPGPDYWVTYFGQFYRSSSLISEGMKRLYWMKDENGKMRIVGEEWDNVPLGLEDMYVRMVSSDALGFIDSWRSAWEAADLDSYIDFYAADARQGGRRGLRSIKEHKVDLWKEKTPLMVGIDDLDVSLHDKGVKVSFIQEYQAEGFSDKGVKTLYLEPVDGSWKIVSENWSAL